MAAKRCCYCFLWLCHPLPYQTPPTKEYRKGRPLRKGPGRSKGAGQAPLLRMQIVPLRPWRNKADQASPCGRPQRQRRGQRALLQTEAPNSSGLPEGVPAGSHICDGVRGSTCIHTGMLTREQNTNTSTDTPIVQKAGKPQSMRRIATSAEAVRVTLAFHTPCCMQRVPNPPDKLANASDGHRPGAARARQPDHNRWNEYAVQPCLHVQTIKSSMCANHRQWCGLQTSKAKT